MRTTGWHSVSVFLFLLLAVITCPTASAQGPIRTIDLSSNGGVNAKTFGVDSLQMATAGPFVESFGNDIPWEIWGMMGLTWQDIEPSEGHDYVWDWTPFQNEYNYMSLDIYMRLAKRYGKKLQIALFTSSTWATEHEVNPDPSDPNFESRWRVHASPILPGFEDDWKNLIEAIIERYDGDGYSDADFVDGTCLIHRIDICGEVESYDHWQGAPIKYFEALDLAFQAANGEIPIGRAPMLTFDVTNDDPCFANGQSDFEQIKNRIYYEDDPQHVDDWSDVNNDRYREFLRLTHLYADKFDVMNIHPIGKYTCTAGFVGFLREEAGDENGTGEGGIGPDKPICADDYIISPHNGYRAPGNIWEVPEKWSLCPKIYENDYRLSDNGPPYVEIYGESNAKEDVFDALDKGAWNFWDGFTGNPPYYSFLDDFYQSYRPEFVEKQAGHLVKRLIFGLASGLDSMFIQPGVDAYEWGDRIYRHGGFIDLLAYNTAKAALPLSEDHLEYGKKPAYHQFKWLYEKLNGAMVCDVLLENSAPGTYFPLACVYRFTIVENSVERPLWVAWQDWVSGGPHFMRSFILENIDSDHVTIYQTFKLEDGIKSQTVPNSATLAVNNNQVQIQFGDSPIFIEETPE